MLDPRWLLLLLIFIRMTSFFVIVPFLTVQGIPALVKIGLAGIISYLIFSVIDAENFLFPQNMVEFMGMAIGEVIVGLTLGFIVFLVFGGIRTAGQIIDLQMSLLMASVFDPQYGSPVTLVGQLYFQLALVYFFIINGHHSLLVALTGSYSIIPVGMHTLAETTVWGLMEIFFWTFLLAFQIALPVVVTILLVDITLGLISKTVPQLHVFMVGLPLKIGAGLLALVLVLPIMTGVFENLFGEMVKEMLNIMGTF